MAPGNWQRLPTKDACVHSKNKEKQRSAYSMMYKVGGYIAPIKGLKAHEPYNLINPWQMPKRQY